MSAQKTSDSTKPLSHYVAHSLDGFFKALNGHAPKDLYGMILDQVEAGDYDEVVLSGVSLGGVVMVPVMIFAVIGITDSPTTDTTKVRASLVFRIYDPGTSEDPPSFRLWEEDPVTACYRAEFGFYGVVGSPRRTH